MVVGEELPPGLVVEPVKMQVIPKKKTEEKVETKNAESSIEEVNLVELKEANLRGDRCTSLPSNIVS